MKWWGGKTNGKAKPAGPVKGPAVEVRTDATDDFPRGRPDGDRAMPVAIGRWPSAEEIGQLLTPWKPWEPGESAMLLLGKDHRGQWYGHADDRHVLTVAGSRAGKGVSLIVPNLCHWPGSVLAIDPKAELATLTASRRSSDGSDWAEPIAGGGDVYALDPFGRVTGPAKRFAKAAYNPMANLNPATDEGQDRANQIADALIVQSQGDGAHWTQAAQSLLRSLILYVAAAEEPDSRNLITVRRLLTSGDAALKIVWAKMVKLGEDNPAYEMIGRMGATMRDRGPGERGSILSSAEVQTSFLEGEAMRRVLCASSFELESLKSRRVTVYLCLPATRLATHGRWLRLMVALAMDAMERTGPLKQNQPPVLFCLDEFAALDRIETVEKAAGQIASFGTKLWPIVQDITQLQRDYKEAWETFMGNAGILTFHGNTDLTTLQHISDRLGQTEMLRTVVNRSEGWGEQRGQIDPVMQALNGGQPNNSDTKSGNMTANESLQTGPLLQASEIMKVFARETKKLLVMIPDKGPVALYRGEYFTDPLFHGLTDPVAEYESPPTRAQRAEMNR
jgi:type IV secretion system protein VirD4